MRMTRKLKYKSMRRKKTRKILLFAVIIPVTFIILGYLVSSVVILPSIAGK